MLVTRRHPVSADAQPQTRATTRPSMRPSIHPSARDNRRWERRYRRRILLTDIAIVVFSVFGAQLLRYGIDEDVQVRFRGPSEFELAYALLSSVIALGWLLCLSAAGSRDSKVFGVGSTEYKRVLTSTLATFGMFAVVAYLAKANVGRGYLLIALPVGLLLLLLGRWLWRKRLHRWRSEGRSVYRTLLIGDRVKSEHVAREIMRSPANGFWIVGAATQKGTTGELVEGVEVVAGFDDAMQAVDRLDADIVILTGSDDFHPAQVRDLSWQLENRDIDLVVAPTITDIAGPRIHTRPVSGLPLIHVELPTFGGRKYFLKRMLDLLGSAALMILASPVMLAVALAVKLSSRGPVFYSQERIGLNGRPFPMFKFRSMVQGADDQLRSLLDAQGTAEKPLHKVENDPRITPVGRFIRKYSLDELPQLFNVFLGTMSLVGPRPQRAAEVALYADSHHRRLLLKPGITGLWQVSGRSDLEWEDAIRLDLYYVENWSLVGDLVLLLKTVRTVIRPVGAH
ncbi:sugar transferase [Leucobacter tenebrionis]|uniref:sugar transferase n=1 Tax=Leucobacter tenebrionis TaxID=2873270 RepID=UPI0021035FFF|nr:sugar transferase [Leucobacter tenebrionis]